MTRHITIPPGDDEIERWDKVVGYHGVRTEQDKS